MSGGICLACFSFKRRHSNSGLYSEVVFGKLETLRLNIDRNDPLGTPCFDHSHCTVGQSKSQQSSRNLQQTDRASAENYDSACRCELWHILDSIDSNAEGFHHCALLK